MVDELCEFSPPLGEDHFFKTLDVDIPYNSKSEQYREKQYQGSAVETYVILLFMINWYQ